MGGPQSEEEIKPFLYRLFSDRDLINFGVPAVLQKPLAYLIATFRTPKVKPHYRAVGYSPVVKDAQRLSQKVAEELKIPMYCAMTYSEPLLEKVSKEINAKCRKVVVITLYPQYSAATSGSCFNKARKLLKVETSFVKSWHDNFYYVSWAQRLLKKALLDAKLESPFVLFSAHSIPKYFLDKKDPYAEQIKETVSLVMRGFNLPYAISYQSKVGPIKWLEPSTSETILNLAKKGIKELVIFPISFVGEHIETLYEIDVELRELAKSAGIKKLVKVPLEQDSLLVKAISSEIKRRL